MAKAGFTLTAELVDEILDAIRRGSPIAHVAAACGVNRQTYYKWRKAGESKLAQDAEREARGLKPLKGTAHQALCVRLYQEAEDAADAGMNRMLHALRDLGVGGGKTTTVREKRFPDGTTERVTTVNVAGPDARALMWLLERRWPALFGPVERGGGLMGGVDDAAPIGRTAADDPAIRARVKELREAVAASQTRPEGDHQNG